MGQGVVKATGVGPRETARAYRSSAATSLELRLAALENRPPLVYEGDRGWAGAHGRDGARGPAGSEAGAVVIDARHGREFDLGPEGASSNRGSAFSMLDVSAVEGVLRDLRALARRDPQAAGALLSSHPRFAEVLARSIADHASVADPWAWRA